MEEAPLSSPAAQLKKPKRTEMKSANRTPKVSAVYNTAPMWAVQCKDCRKWRGIPTQEEYEEIRRKSVEDPFTCKRKDKASCNDSADLEFGTGHLWVLDRPNIPKCPSGFKRKLTLRKSLPRLDCYYETPAGKKLRGISEVAMFLEEHPECKDVSAADFCFRAPKIAKESKPLAGVWGEQGK